MPFVAVPEESKKQINKAGAILTLDTPSQADLSWAIALADRWRACHAYPINTFQATLRTRLKTYQGDPIAAQRLKRMPTIIDKLKRYPNMKLTTMQDIGGVRAILNSLSDVYDLAESYRESQRFPHNLVDQRDYIQNPRDEDGYRSIHLIYRYRNSQANNYNDLRIELQIRTRLQHTWATAVETMGTLLGQALKSRVGDREWLNFFALISAIFAIDERSPTLPRFLGQSREDLSASVASLEASLDALTLMRGLSVAASKIYEDNPRKGWSYHLIILNSLKRTLRIKSYDRDSLDQALSDYSTSEAEAAKGEKIEPVLVSAGSMQKLRRAYPNFFLDINEFGESVNKICTDARK